MAGCIFCGTVPQTKTHIFRKAWLESLFPSDQSFMHHHVRNGDNGFDNWWEAQEFGLAPRAACQPCNGGWMSAIDYAAEALIEPCVLGNASAFGAALDHRIIARWMTLVAILFDQTQEKPIISPDIHRAFHDEPEPCEGSFMWLAATPATDYTVNGWPRSWKMRSSVGETNGYFCTFRVKHLVAQVYLPPDREAQSVEFDRDGNPQVVSIWPSPGPVSWPPEAIRADQLEIFANQFTNT